MPRGRFLWFHPQAKSRRATIDSVQDLIAKAATLHEALPYIQRFRSQIFVVKYGGSFMDSPDPAVADGSRPGGVFLGAAGSHPAPRHGRGQGHPRPLVAVCL